MIGPEVRFGLEADFGKRPAQVRLASDNGHWLLADRCPLIDGTGMSEKGLPEADIL